MRAHQTSLPEDGRRQLLIKALEALQEQPGLDGRRFVIRRIPGER